MIERDIFDLKEDVEPTYIHNNTVDEYSKMIKEFEYNEKSKNFKKYCLSRKALNKRRKNKRRTKCKT